jgi:hypothetical protein
MYIHTYTYMQVRKQLFEGRATRYAKAVTDTVKSQLYAFAKSELDDVLWALNNTSCAIPESLEEHIENFKKAFPTNVREHDRLNSQELIGLADTCMARAQAVRNEEANSEYWWSCEGCKAGFKSLLSAYRYVQYTCAHTSVRACCLVCVYVVV